jgi:transposase-like protein
MIEINRQLVQGKSISAIAREYGVSTNSIAYHKENHLSRQLTQAYERKGLAESMDLLSRIDRIIDRAELIFTRNFAKENISGDTLALKALGEQRSTIELLAKISAYLHEARLLELQNNQANFEQEQAAAEQEAMKLLTTEELEILYYLNVKMAGEEIPTDMIPDIFRVPAQPQPRPRPAPKQAVEAILPAPTDPVEEAPDILPRGLPPAPSQQISGWDSSCKPGRPW